MIFRPTAVDGVLIVEPQPIEDERGFFARTFCADAFATRGLVARVAQCSLSFNPRRGTLRGLHYQRPPHGEAKLVRCTAGAVLDVAVDLRPQSKTFRRHVAVELTPQSRAMLYVPEGVAHGFQTLVDDSEVFYQISAPHRPEAAAGVRWNDRAFGIAWPLPVTAISERDRSYPDFGDGPA